MAELIADLSTPCLLVDLAVFESNVATMARRWPGERLRPHVKTFKSTALALRLQAAGHSSFACATVREIEGMAAAGLGHDLLLANEVVGRAADRLGAVAASDAARVTVAVDSAATVTAAAAAGVREVLIDVDIGMHRCGCDPAAAGLLADLARAKGLSVRGVMGFEGHLLRQHPIRRRELVAAAGEQLLAAHADVGGELVSGGGTATWQDNKWATELQAGSYCLMDSEYATHAPAFRLALTLLTTVVSLNDRSGVLDGGLKSLSTDHGAPTVLEVGDCQYVSDEHIVFCRRDGADLAVGDRVQVLPSHVDPTVALHDRLYVVAGDEVVDVWPVDLRGW